MSAKRRKAGAAQVAPPAAIDARLSPARWAMLGLASLTLLVFSNTLNAGLALDSVTLVQKDPRIRAATLANLALIAEHSYYWPSGEAGLYRPLTTLSYFFNYSILGAGDQPAGYHWLNVLLHLANVLLLFALARRMIPGLARPLLIAAIWGVHPILTEAVSNVAGRADLLATLGVFASILCYLRARDMTGTKRILSLTAMAAATTLGVFAKENAVVLPALIVLYELAQGERRIVKTMLAGCCAAGIPILAMLGARFMVLANSAPAEFLFVDNPILSADFIIARTTALRVAARYLGLIVWPTNLSSDYSYASILPTGGALPWIVSLAAVSALAVFLVWHRPCDRAIFFGGLALIAFLPVSNLVLPIGTIMAERLLYLPSAGLLACSVLAAFWGADRLKQRQPRVIGLLIAVVLLLSVRTWQRNQDWQDDLSITSSDASGNPASFKLHTQLARLLFESDNTHANLDRVIAEAEKGLQSLALLPQAQNVVDPYRMAGGYYLVFGELEHSAPAFERALQILGRGATVQRTLRIASDERIDAWRSRGHADVVIPVPDDSAIYQLLTAAYLRTGNREGALDAVHEALSALPRNPQAYREIAATLVDHGRLDESASALWTGIQLAPGAGLDRDLISLYRESGSACAVLETASGTQFNPRCEAVRKHYCAASGPVTLSLRREGRVREAEQQRNIASRDYACP